MAKYIFPELPEDATKDAKKEILRVRAESTRTATRDVLTAVIEGADDDTLSELKAKVAEALAFLADRSRNRKGTAGEGIVRSTKSNVVADYFAEKKPGEHVDAADVFFDLDMDPARVLSSLKRFVSSVKDKDTRVWVSYSKADRAYIVAGRGENAPKGFTAYAAEVDASDIT